MKNRVVYVVGLVLVLVGIVAGANLLSQNNPSIAKTSLLQDASSLGGVIPNEDTIRFVLRYLPQRTNILYQSQLSNSLHSSAPTPQEALLSMHPCQLYLFGMMIYHTESVSWDFQQPRKWFSTMCQQMPEYGSKMAEINSCLEIYNDTQTDFGSSDFQNFMSAKHALQCQFNDAEHVPALSKSYEQSKTTFCAEMKTRIKQRKAYFYDEKQYYDQDCVNAPAASM